MRFRALFVLLGLAPADALAGTFVVDANGGGPTFQTIQAAIDQAAAGDTIVIRPGDYSSFLLDKPLILLGEAGVRVQPDVIVRDIGAGSFAGIAGMHLGAMDVLDCDGTVVLDQVVVEDWPFATAPSRPCLVNVDQCRDVRVHASEIDADLGTTNLGRDALRSRRSRVEVTACDLLGNEGSDATPCVQPAPAGAGITVTAGALHVARTTVTGGLGTDYGACTGNLGGDGGPAIDAIGKSSVLAAGSPAQRIQGGLGGFGYSPNGDEDGRSGDGVRMSPQSTLRHSGVPVLAGGCLFNCGLAINGGTATMPAPPDPTLERFTQPDGTTAYRVYGQPGATARLFVGVTPAITAQPGSPVELLLVPVRTFDLGPIPPVGSLEHTVPEIQYLPSGLVLAQAEVTFAPNDVRLTESIPLLRLANPCPAGAGADCNGNGMDDACEIAVGLAADCNGNAVPDDCDIAAGQKDLNGNGVLDACETFKIVFVDDDAPGDPGPGDALVSDPLEDGSPAHPFDGISEALKAAKKGDLVSILDGVYTGPKNVNISNVAGKKILIKSRNGPTACIVDMQQTASGILFRSQETPSTIVDGITFVNGGRALNMMQTPAVPGPGPSPTIRNCVFQNNLGGAIFMTESSSRIEGCTFTGNQTSGTLAGAITVVGGRPEITGCTFTGNQGATDGGAISVTGVDEGARIENCLFLNNAAAGLGGAVRAIAVLKGAPLVEIRNCVMLGNSAAEGGAVYAQISSSLQRPDSLLHGCTIVANAATQSGGGVRILGPSTLLPEIRNCVLWGNTAPAGAQLSLKVFFGSILADVAFSDLQGGIAAVDLSPGAQVADLGGIVDVDPAFAGDGFHLSAGSPLTDLGDPGTLLFQGESDIDGEPRLAGAAVDPGADETGP